MILFVLLFIFVRFRPSFLFYQGSLEDPDTAKKAVLYFRLWFEEIDFSLFEEREFGKPNVIFEVYSAHIEGDSVTAILSLREPIFDEGYYEVEVLIVSTEKMNLYSCMMLWLHVKQLEVDFIQYVNSLRVRSIQSSDILMLMNLDSAIERLANWRD